MQTLDPASQPLTSPSYTVDDWLGGYQSQPEEFAYWVETVEGEIPLDLEGTLFRNGPGLLEVNGYPLRHPFDGDGMINAIAFRQGRAYYQNRFVRTAGYVAEQAAKKPLYRGVFGSQKPGGWWANVFDLTLKNIANTNVIYWGGKLLALWEAAHPYRLDPATLETLGLDDLDGLLPAGTAFSAHPRIDPHCVCQNGTAHPAQGQPRLVNFSVKAGPSSTITLYEFDPSGRCSHQYSHAIPGFAFLHDFALTPNYAIFFQNPVSFNPLPYLLGFKGAAECIAFDPKQTTKVILIPRDGVSPVQVLETEPCFVFHHANAFEQDGQIIVDSICYQSFPSLDEGSSFREVDFDQVPESQLWRFQMDLTSKQITARQVIQRSCEFPSLNPAHMGRPYRYLYLGGAHSASGNAPLQAILKVDLATGQEQVWSAAPRGFAGEPVFVPRPGSQTEDDGWVLVLTYNAARGCSDLVILDARDLSAIARLYLKHHVPYGLHGSFVSEYFGPKTEELTDRI